MSNAIGFAKLFMFFEEGKFPMNRKKMLWFHQSQHLLLKATMFNNTHSIPTPLSRTKCNVLSITTN
jgi:hypothetical protein